jgi:uncharacterized protein YggU (UPF0235/DUF167 family)
MRYVDEILHVWVTAPPVEGAANGAVIALLARQLGIARGRITILRGATARHKQIAISGMAPETVRVKLDTEPADR